MTKKVAAAVKPPQALPAGYAGIHGGIVQLLDAARQAAARSVNSLMTASYWEIGRRIVEAEQKGRRRAGYGEQLMERLSGDLTPRFGRGFGVNNLENMRRFFLAYPLAEISQTVSGKLSLTELSQAFTLPWSAYVRLLSVADAHARSFYAQEAMRGGWSVRQLDRQIGSQFYERTALSKDKAMMLAKGGQPRPEDAVTPDEAIKDPYVLEFLNLKDEYSESDLETALIQRLEDFLLELGEGFTFVGRQRRLRIDQTWYRVDLLQARGPPKLQPRLAARRPRPGLQPLFHDFGIGRQISVLVHIGADQLRQVLVTLGRNRARGFEALADRRVGQARAQRGLQLGQDLGRQVLGRGKRKPAGQRIALERGVLAQRRHILEAGQARGRGHAQRLHAPVLQERAGRER